MIEFLHRLKTSVTSESPRKVSDQTEYFAVPSLFDKRKEEAQAFVEQIRKSIGSMTWSILEVRKVVLFFLDARIKALANKQERTFTKKQVMSDLK